MPRNPPRILCPGGGDRAPQWLRLDKGPPSTEAAFARDCPVVGLALLPALRPPKSPPGRSCWSSPLPSLRGSRFDASPLHPRHLPRIPARTLRTELSRLLRRARAVLRLGAPTDGRRRAPRDLHVHSVCVSRDRLAPSAPRKPRARGRSGLAVDDLPRARRPRARRVAAPGSARTRRAPRADHAPGCTAGPRRDHARGHCAHRLELERRREGAVPRLAELGPLDEGGALRQRRVRLGRELPRRQLPEEADSRVHGQDGQPARRLLAGDDARHLRRQRVDGGTAADVGIQAARRVPRSPHGRPAAAEERP